MQLPAELRLVHEPARLQLMRLLYERGDIGLAAARTTLALTPGNLDGHVRRLETEGWLTSSRTLLRSGFEVRLRITRKGLGGFEDYLGWLRDFLSDATNARTPE